LLVVGRDMSDLYEIESVIWRAIGAGSVLALLLAIAAVFMFRRKIESLIFDIRRTALEVEAGNLSRRIPIASAGDEFSRLGEDINRMLDRIEHLMDGVRHVSNVIAHNLKTPLARIRNRIDAARMGRGNGQAATTELTGAADFAIEHIDGLIVVFDKLLQIAQAESDTRRRPFESVDLVRLAADVVDLYAAVAEEQGIELVAELDASARISGDPDLLASALTNLLDNALVHAPGSPRIVVSVHVRDAARRIELAVTDQGPGIDDAHKGQVLERFFRLDRERPGSGLGLSIVSAIAHLHGAGLALEDARPGLRVRLSFPLPGGDLAES
jgi:signal transduction histidine kinase